MIRSFPSITIIQTKHTFRITSRNVGSIKKGASQIAKKLTAYYLVYRRHDKILSRALLHTPLFIKKGSLNPQEEFQQEQTHVLTSLTSLTRLHLLILQIMTTLLQIVETVAQIQ
ncbi:unnamed protein product [Paramecium octaurelia]|uniref:Uncharacterized protein n=1 Tax=Paramecium octaurelia TaxID=43137 RepID=A0A8S1TRY8_PAROT|nr:unnamed protein product [Paramecium octaurelia]